MSDARKISRDYMGTLAPLPGVYVLDPVHTFAEFVTQHLVVGHVRGRFDQVNGKADIADIADDPALSSLEVSIDTASVSTHNAIRDADLRSPRFFDVDKFPAMRYESAKIVA